MEEIKIKIHADATLSYEVRGVKGRTCKDLTKALDAISGKVLETKTTGEYHQPATVRADVNQGH